MFSQKKKSMDLPPYGAKYHLYNFYICDQSEINGYQQLCVKLSILIYKIIKCRTKSKYTVHGSHDQYDRLYPRWTRAILFLQWNGFLIDYVTKNREYKY